MKLDSPALDEHSFLTFKTTLVYFNKPGSFCGLVELAASFGLLSIHTLKITEEIDGYYTVFEY